MKMQPRWVRVSTQQVDINSEHLLSTSLLAEGVGVRVPNLLSSCVTLQKRSRNFKEVL